MFYQVLTTGLTFSFSCPQSEAFERRSDANGLYMKHLINHIHKDEKIEDILHKVGAG